MIVRQATRDDVPTVLDMGARFYATTDYAAYCPFSREAGAVLVDMMVDSGILLVAEEDGVIVGMVGLVVVPFAFNHEFLAAHEVMWWVEPGHRQSVAGGSLLLAIEPECRARGIGYLEMKSLRTSPAAVEMMYGRMGLARSESSYTKVI